MRSCAPALGAQPLLRQPQATWAQVGGAADHIGVALAWAYVALRVAHSLVQATRNVIMVRFSVFALGSLVLFALLVNTVLCTVA